MKTLNVLTAMCPVHRTRPLTPVQRAQVPYYSYNFPLILHSSFSTIIPAIFITGPNERKVYFHLLENLCEIIRLLVILEMPLLTNIEILSILLHFHPLTITSFKISYLSWLPKLLSYTYGRFMSVHLRNKIDLITVISAISDSMARRRLQTENFREELD